MGPADSGVTADSALPDGPASDAPAADAPATDAPAGDAAGGSCGTMTCGPGQICAATTTVGGACMPVDGGCKAAEYTTYECAALPASCGGTPSCECAGTLCDCMCDGATATSVHCTCYAP
jgi:hypothetical protein